MNRNEALEKITGAVRNPLKPVEAWKSRSGGKVVGVVSCMPPFAPEELIHAAGLLPVGIWGGDVPVSLADAKMQSFACSVARTSLELALKGVFSPCDGFVFPFCCDAFQNLSEVWKLSIDRPCFQFVFPKKVDRGSVRTYLEKELLRVQGELEAFSGQAVTAAKLRESIRLYNEHRRRLRKLDEIRARDPGFLTAVRMMEVVLSSTFLPKEEHLVLLEALLADAEGSGRTGKGRGGTADRQVRVLLTGVMPRPATVAAMLEEVGFQVLGDDLGLGSLFYSLEIPDSGNPLRDLADGYLAYPPCSTLHNPAEQRSASLIRRVRAVGAEGLLIFATKFCEPEFFDYPYLKEDLEQAGVPVLLLETELGPGEPGQIRTRLEAFLETVRGKRNG